MLNIMVMIYYLLSLFFVTVFGMILNAVHIFVSFFTSGHWTRKRFFIRSIITSCTRMSIIWPKMKQKTKKRGRNTFVWINANGKRLHCWTLELWGFVECLRTRLQTLHVHGAIKYPFKNDHIADLVFVFEFCFATFSIVRWQFV